MTDEELARRACVLVRDMLKDAARHLARVDFGELNDVMFEAERRGYYRETAT
jgi:hypothetical protein